MNQIKIFLIKKNQSPENFQEEINNWLKENAGKIKIKTVIPVMFPTGSLTGIFTSGLAYDYEILD